MLTQARLKELFNHNPETGLFTRLIGVKSQAAGKIAGGLTKKGYIALSVDGKMHLGHRLAFLYMTGEWPKDQVDHKNEIKSDNRWNNIREATRAQNFKNVGARKNSKTGVKGVSKSKNGYLVMFCLGTYKIL